MNTVSNLLPDNDEVDFTFERKDSPVPPSLRAERKVSLIVVILYKNSYREKASPLKLQLFNWALNSSQSMERLKKFVLEGDKDYKPDVIHLDPSVNRGVDMAVAEGMAEIDSRGKVVLSDRGRDLAKKILDSDDVLSKEINDLNEIKKKVSENKLMEIIDGIF